MPILRLIVVALHLLAASAASAAVITANGSISDTDFAATDGVGDFFYDVYVLTNGSGVAQTVTLSLQGGPTIQPFLAYWTTSVLPDDDWSSPVDLYAAAAAYQGNPNLGSGVSLPNFVLNDGASVQIAVTTNNYPAFAGTLGTYELTVTAASTAPPLRLEQIEPSLSVPEPATFALFGLGLVGLATSRRRRHSPG